MSAPILYATEISPPCRGVLLAAAALGIALDFRQTNLQAGEHLTPEFLKMNPAHTIPTLDDGGFILWDSHAIMCYLADKYGKNDALYPKDLQLRAKVDQFLQFDNGYLYSTMRSIFQPIAMTGNTNVPKEKLDKLSDTFDLLNKLLEGRNWLVGDSFTLADISCASTMSTFSAFRPLDNYPNIKAWMKRCEETLPEYAEKNEPGNKMFHGFIRSKLPGYL